MIERILTAITGSMSTQNGKVKNLKGIVAGLDVELDAISKTLGKGTHKRPCSETQNSAMRHKLGRIGSALSVLQTENDSVKQQLHEKEDDVKEIQKMIGLVEAQSDKLVHINDEIQNYETEIKGMRTDLMAGSPMGNNVIFDDDVAQIRAKHNLQSVPPRLETRNRAEQLVAPKTNQRIEPFDMRAVLDSIKTKYDEVCEDNEEIKRERSSSIDKKQQLQEALDSLTKARQNDAVQHHQELRAFKGQINKAKQSIADNNSDITTMRAKQQALHDQLADARGSENAMKRDLCHVKGDNERLRMEVTEMQNEQKQQSLGNADMERSVRNAQSEHLALRDAMQRQSDEFGRYQSCKEQLIEQVNAQLGELQREMGKVHTQRAEMEMMVEQKDRERAQVQQSLDELQSSLADREDTVNSFRSDKVGLLAEVKNGQRIQNMLQKQLEAFKKETAAQQHQIARLTEQNTQMSRSRPSSGQASKYHFHHYEADAAGVGVAVDEHRSDGVMLMNNVKDLKSQSAMVQSKINEMRSRTKQMQNGLKHNVKQPHRERRSSIMNLKREIQRIQNMNLHI